MKELIRRAESIERAAWSHLYREAPRRVRRRLGLQAVERGYATLLSASRADHLLLNRAIGVRSDGVADATAPEARRQGCQRALMAARLKRAQRLGCVHVFTETGMPVEGEPNSSYRNMLRVGFDELHVRDNFAPEDSRWHHLPSSDAIAKSAVSPKPSRTWLKAVVPSGS
jgi:GNAT superfamily N-acetyltransferase